MKQAILLIVILLSFGCSKPVISNIDNEIYNVIERPVQIQSFTPPEVEKFKLDSGQKVYFVQNTELPLFNCSFIFPRGTLLKESNEEKVNYQALSFMLRSGGAGHFSPDEFEKEIQKLNGVINVSINAEYSAITFSALSDDFDKISELVSLMWNYPKFDQNKLTLWQMHAKESVLRRSENPDEIAGIGFNQLLLNKSGLEKPLISADLLKVNRDTLQKLHLKLFNDYDMRVIISGPDSKDITKENLEKLLRVRPSYDLKLNRDNIKFKQPSSKKGLYFVEQPFEQASIILGLLGPERLPTDFAEIDIFNSIFGADGDFSSLLVKQIRSQLGLSYSVNGGIFPDYPYGRSAVSLQTKNESAGEALSEVTKILNDIKNGKIELNHIQDSKTSVSSNYVFGFDSISEVAVSSAFRDLFNYPLDFDEKYLSRISDVDKNGIIQVADKYWPEDKFLILVVGSKKALNSIKTAINKKWLPKFEVKAVTFGEQLNFVE